MLVLAAAWEAVLSRAVARHSAVRGARIGRIAQSFSVITPSDIAVTLAQVIGALILSFVLGVALAMAMYRSDTLAQYLHRSSGC